jgi:hypothetical protein
MLKASCVLIGFWAFAHLPAAAAQERAMESVVPALTYSRSCSSAVLLQNLAETPVTVEIEPHRSSGALVPLAGEPGMTIHLAPGQQGTYKLRIDEDDDAAWVKVRERIRPPRTSPAVAVGGSTECRAANQLRTAARLVAYPTRNPWFSGDVSEMRGAVVTLINTSSQAVRAWACYSAGNLYSVPDKSGPKPDLSPICSSTLDVQIPPFGSRELPVEREGTRQFSLRTQGDAIVLQMLRPSDEGVRIFTVDSSIKFGEEVREEKGGRK